MTNPFSMEAIQPPAEPTTDNPFALGNIQNDQAAQLRNTLRTAVQTKADAASEVSRLRKRYPAPEDVLLRNLEEAKYIEAADIAGETLKVSPILADSLRKHPWLAREAHPDIKPLAGMEERVRKYGELKAWNGPAPTFGSVLSGLAKSVPQGFRAARAGLDLQMTDALEALGLIEPDPVFKANLLRKSAQAAGASSFTTPDFESSTASGVYGGVASTLRMLPGLSLSLATKSPAPALAAIGVQTEAESYVKYRARGAEPGMAVLGAVGEGAVEVATELPAMKFLVGKLGKAGASEFIAGLIAREIPGEQVATLLQDAIDTAVANPDKTWEQYLSERPEAAYQTLVATLTQSAIMGGVNTAVERFARDSNRQADAVGDAEHLQDQLRMAAGVALRENNPDEFRTLVQAMADNTDGAPKEVYVDAEVLNQLAPEVLAQLPGVAAQMADALAANSVVSIPVGDVLTVAPGTPLEQLLVENARIGDPTAMSQVEAKQAGEKAQEFLAQEAQRVIQQATDQQAMQESSDRVRQGVLDQLNAVGRFRKEVNEGYATWTAAFYTTMAGRLGITPEEMAAKYPLRIVDKTGAGTVLNTQADRTQSVTLAGRDVPVTLSRQDAQAGYSLTNVDTALFDAGFKAADDQFRQFYVGAQGEGGIAGRYERFAEFSATAKSVEAPTVSVDANGKVSFGNGRHRFAFMRDSGVPTVPVAMDAESLANATRFGYTIGNSGAFDPNDANILKQADAKVNNLTSVAERGERITGTRATFTAEEKQAVKDSAEKIGVSEKEITATVRGHKLAHPQAQGWAPLTFVRAEIDEGKVTYVYKPVPYSFSSDADGKQISVASPAYKKRVNAVAKAMVEDVRRVFQRATNGDKNAKNILAQAGWYKAMRARLRQEFGGLGDVFADLLGATSPNTPVRDNWTNAVDTLRRASRGDYDTLLPKWVEWADTVDALELDLRGWFNDRLAEGLSKKAVKDLPEYKTKIDALKAARKLDDSFLPTKESGKKYGFNGRNVARAMVDLWRVVKNADPDIGRGDTAPKALNFSGNLIGFRERATIDVWAARMLQRLAGGARVPSMAETGVSGAMREDGTTTLQFGMGQDIFAEAAKRIRADAELKTDEVLAKVNDDDLQAVVWFIEKELWTVNNWTSAAGEGGSFELEASLSGSADQARIKELRRVIDSSKSKPDAKAAARAELATLERTVDRFVGGLSTQMSLDTQGVDFVPTDADMARLAESVRLAAYESDNGATVLASKMLSTEGRYGGVERSLDMEVVAREGYDPTALWAEMLRQAQEARQDSTFLSRVLRDGEAVDPLRHRPGVEIYFREAAQAAQLETTLAELAKEGVEFLTVIVDGRRMPGAVAGAMPPAVGVRLQYVPEFDQRYGFDNLLGLDDAALAAKIQEKAREMKDLAARVLATVDGVAFAGQFWHDTQVAFSHQYQEKLDAIAAGNVEEGPAGTRGEVWSGQPVRAGLENADRQSRETAGGEPDSGTDPAVAGDAQANRPLEQGPRGTFAPANLELALNENADLSTFLHETGHFFLGVMADLASQPGAPADIAEDMGKLLKWFGITGDTDPGSDGVEGFHGTPETFTSFTVKNEGELGDGFYFSADKGSARKWGERKTIMGADGQMVPVENRRQVNVIRARINIRNPASGADVAAAKKAIGADWTPQQVTAALKAQGFDGVVSKEDNEIVAFDAGQIRTGRTPLETWNALPLDGKRPYHERFAESFEQYLMEGKAPSVELQPLFRKFKSWLLNVYQSIKAFVDGRDATTGIQLSPEIRQVFDRMLASQEQIAQAEEVAGLLPEEDATAEALEKLTARSLRDLKWTVNARAKAIKELQKQAATLRKGVLAEVTAEVNQMPEFQAKEMLAAMRKENKEQLNDTELAIIADAFQYPGVDAMLKAIDAAGSKADVIQGMTDQRMLERHGDLIDQRAIEAAANEAVHNEARARSLATELKSQAEALNPRRDTGQTNAAGSRITVNALVEAAKQFGANIVSKTPLRDLKAKAAEHTAAERRAGKRWTEATSAGKTEEAIKAKQDQMLNHAAARAAMDAQAEMRKMLEFFKRVVKDGNEKTVSKGRDPDVVNAARAILGAYGVAPKGAKTAMEYMELVEKNDPAMFAALQPSMQGALNMAQPLDALTMDELRGLHEEIQAMWHLAKRSRQMEVDGKLLDREDLAEELYARMGEIGIPDQIPGEGKAVTKAEQRALFLRQGLSFLRRVEQWAEGMDGKYGGPFLRYVFQPIKLAADRYRSDRAAYRKKLQALVDNIAPIIGDSVINAPELGYEFGTPGSTRGTAMNEILHAVLHTGNESNKRKLLLGRKWATENADGTLDTTRWDSFIQRLVNEGKLQPAHFDFVQGVWDLMESTKPLAQKAHRDAYGRYFAEVTADSFIDPWGQSRRGGYAPAVVDPEMVKDNELRKLAEAENENMTYAFPAPNRGFTKGRVEYNRPLLLDLRSIGQHLDKVLLFSHMTAPAADVRRLVSHKQVGYGLTHIDPSVVSGMLQPWLQRSAQQIVETPIPGAGKWARVPSIVRARAGMALMFANVSNAIQQVTGLSMAMVKVKPSYMMRALAQHVAHPVKTAQAVWAASPYMDDRAKNEVAVLNEQMQDILVNPSVYEKAQAWSSRHAYFLQTAVDNALSPIVWTGAYNQAMAEGQLHDDAVRFADGTVRQTQGSTLPEDVSRFETGPAYARAFTQFIGYFNMVANTNAVAIKQIANEVGLKNKAGRAFNITMMGLLVPIWAAEAIALAFRGGPEDEDDDGYLDDWLAQVFGFGTVKGLLAMIPIAGQAANSAVTRLDNNPMNDRISLSPGLSLLESALGGNVQTVAEILDSDKEVNARRAVRDAATLVSVFTGLPAYAVARPAGYLAGMADDKIDPTGPVDLARGLITGSASPESK